jgi:uncharacterized repeat protein (TIGR03803 family)
MGGPSDGTGGSRLIADEGGALYGTSPGGGASNINAGTVFKLTPPAKGQTVWKEIVLYSFMGGPTDGSTPLAGLTADEDGTLYGTTVAGGSSGTGTNGPGTVFKLTLHERVLEEK